MQTMTFATIVVPLAFVISVASLLMVGWLDKKQRPGFRSISPRASQAVVFLFDDDILTDSTPAAQQMLANGDRHDTETDWAHLSMLLSPLFPDFDDKIYELAEKGHMTLISNDGSKRVEAEWTDGRARIELVEAESKADGRLVDRLSLDAMQHELDSLRLVSHHVPLMIWREDASGAITWANKTYLDAVADYEEPGQVSGWPPQKLFERPHINDATELDEVPRIQIASSVGRERGWFDLHSSQVDDETLFTAVPADRMVEAERSQKDFVTTLTKTFAHLPIGLAIFNRKRQLTLFNPALTDLIDLPVSFLVGKPALFSFLDQLRENRMMPEPRDYVSWRQRISDLESAAASGTYEETWSLPTGQTYRVTGRPHPNGAIAFLFEDISSETSLTRRFHAELEMGQSVLDSLGEAIAVFSAGGILSMSNRGYSRLWGTDPSTSLQDVNLGDAIRTWQAAGADGSVWQELKEFVATHGERKTWQTQMTLLDGRQLECRFTPMARGATMVSFRSAAARISSGQRAGGAQPANA